MTIDNDNDMMLKSEKIDLQTPVVSASNGWYFCDAHKKQFGDDE